MKLKGPDKARFERIFSEGRRAGGSLAKVISLPGTGEVGIATAKKIGNRPQRNRAKRRFREAIRTQPEIANPRLDFIVIVNADASEAAFGRIQEEVRSLFLRACEKWADELECS